MCLFGEVKNAEIELSPLGVSAHDEWKKIPTHYSNVQLDKFRIMPNHIHGIINILDPHRNEASLVPTERTRRDNARVVQTEHDPGRASAHSLSSIIGSYRFGVTKRIHEVNCMSYNPAIHHL